MNTSIKSFTSRNVGCNVFLTLFFQGSPYSRADLRAVNVNLADMVIIFSPSLAKEEEHQALSDKESILVTQNLKAMSFEKVDITESGDKGTNNGEAVQNNPVAIPSHIAEVQATGSTRGANIPIITELGEVINYCTSSSQRYHKNIQTSSLKIWLIEKIHTYIYSWVSKL